MNFLTINEFKDYAEKNPIDYLVSDLIKEGTFNLCSGEAKSGKSTLVRYLASCITKGEPFLGRETKKGSVLFACPDETDTTELFKAFYMLGVNGDLYIDPSPVEKSTLIPDLGKWVEQVPDVKLVILDTLAKTVQYEDMNNYDKVVRDFSPLQEFARETGVAVLALHHTNKSSGNSIAASLMGSGGLASLAATTLEMSSFNGNRQLRTLHRYGKAIDRADIFHDPNTGVLSLGRSQSEKAQATAIVKIGELETKIIELVTRLGSATREDINKGVTGNAQAKVRTTGDLVKRGILTKSGTGSSKLDPFRFSPAAIPMEKAA